uniref:Integrase catalytic domain-containing protein n=1 Tax=Tanacetum cinerariifolium TaxID=118510 RepID=A0A6L2MWR9_TANCI|nr:hypothetical protein [Tanacetum cinerariifolium]
MQTQTSNALHNAIMKAGGKDRPPMLASGKVVSVTEGSSEKTTKRYMENYKNLSQDICDQLNAEAEAVQIILIGIDNDIYSTVDACPNAFLTSTTTRMTKHQNKVNEIRAKRLAHTANPLALVAKKQPAYHPQNHHTHYTQNSSTRSQQAATRNKGKAIVNSLPPIYDQEPTMVVKDDEMSKDKEIDQELEAHYMYMSQIQKVTSDVANNSRPIFDTEPLQKVDQDDDDDLASERDLLASLIEKLKCEIDDSKNHNKFLETSNKALVDKLKGSRGTDLYSITLQDTSSPNPICLMAKATFSQAWLWHCRLSHLNFDTINLLLNNDIVIGLLKLVQKGLHAQVRTVRTGKGTKFLNKTLLVYFAAEGIQHQTSVAQTPKQNGVVERRNRILVEAARTMLSAPKVPLFFWAEVIATTCFTQNLYLIIPRHEKTPYHIINNRKPSLKFFHIFCSLCYIIRDGENLDACIFVGYSTQSRAYRVFNKRTRVIVETIHVNFDELPQIASDHVSSDPFYNLESDGEMCMFALIVSRTEPNNIKEAMADSAWIESMQEELSQFDRLEVCELFDRPVCKNVINMKWLWKNKRDVENTIIHNKSHLVAKGYAQKEGVDFE